MTNEQPADSQPQPADGGGETDGTPGPSVDDGVDHLTGESQAAANRSDESPA